MSERETLYFAETHRPNYVTEGSVETESVRTRVKCDGDDCDFYAEHRSWYAALGKHAEHVADLLAARDARIREDALAPIREQLAAAWDEGVDASEYNLVQSVTGRWKTNPYRDRTRAAIDTSAQAVEAEHHEDRSCMYGFPHPEEYHTMHGFACQREEHARAAVFG